MNKKETKDYKILVVDDEPANLRIIVESLENSSKHYQAMISDNGVSALKITEKLLPDLIITDWDMPKMNGIELIKHLKQDPRTKNIPVIICTGIMLSSENLQTALEAGAIDYLRKPVDPIEITARTQSALKLAESYKLIKEQNDFKDRILSIIAHDLRGPIGNMKALFDAVCMDDIFTSQSEQTRMFELGQQQAGATVNLLENLLWWARSEQNQITCTLTEQMLLALVDESLKLYELHIKDKKIRVYNNLTNADYALIDKQLISVVIRNLISNAVKFAPKSGEIKIGRTYKNDRIQFEVSNNGDQIAPETIEKIINRGDVKSTHGTNNEKGSGFGLNLCVEFLELHKSELQINSTSEQTTFSFELDIPED